MANKKVKRPSKRDYQEMDGPYILKLVLYLVLGTFWLSFVSHNGSIIPIPIGLVLGILVARHEKLQIDKKIEYAVLLIAMLVGYFLPYGLYIHV